MSFSTATGLDLHYPIRTISGATRRYDECEGDFTPIIPVTKETCIPQPPQSYYDGWDLMPFMYAAPFMLLSGLAFLVCIAVPRWRRYKLQALVAPVAFGFCSVVAMGAIVVTAVYMRLGLFSKPWSGPRDAMPFVFIYIMPGLLGSWCAVAIVTKIAARLHDCR